LYFHFLLWAPDFLYLSVFIAAHRVILNCLLVLDVGQKLHYKTSFVPFPMVKLFLSSLLWRITYWHSSYVQL